MGDYDDLLAFGAKAAPVAAPAAASADPYADLMKWGVPEAPSQGQSAARGALQGASLGFGDEASAAIDTAVSHIPGLRTLAQKLHSSDLPAVDNPDLTYSERRQAYREKNRAAQEANPWTYGLSELGGGLATGKLIPVGSAKTLGGAIVQGAKAGAKLGAVNALGSSEADLTQGDVGGAAADVGKGMALGGLFGGAIAGGGHLVGKALTGNAARLKKWIGADLAGETKGASTMTAKKMVADDLDDIADVVTSDPHLDAAIFAAQKQHPDTLTRAIDAVDTKIAEVTAPRAELWQQFDQELAATNARPATKAFSTGTAPPPFNTEPGFFHVGLKKIDKIGPDLSLAESADEAIPYINGNKGFIHRIDLKPSARIASEKHIRAAAAEVGSDGKYVFEMADDPAVRKALRDDGYDAIRYDDMGPDNAYEHVTVRLLNPDAAIVSGVAPVSDGSILDHATVGGGTAPAGEVAGAEVAAVEPGVAGVRAGDYVDHLENAIQELRATGKGSDRAVASELQHHVSELKTARDWGYQPAAANPEEAQILANLQQQRTAKLARGEGTADVDRAIGELSANNRAWNPDHIVPAERLRADVTDLQREAAQRMGGINGTPNYLRGREVASHGEDYLRGLMDQVGTRNPQLVAQIAEHNRQYSALARMRDILDQRLSRAKVDDLGGLGEGKIAKLAHLASKHGMTKAATVGAGRAIVSGIRRGQRLGANLETSAADGDRFSLLVLDGLRKGLPLAASVAAAEEAGRMAGE